MELQCSDELYLCFRDLVLGRAGLHYPAHKRADLLHGLGLALKAGGYANLAGLYAEALSSGDTWDLILTHLTIGETYFFRNGPQFDALREQIIPEILRRHADTRGLRVWSAGCATGEEPYSLAMTIGDLLPDPALWHASILATDINPETMALARTTDERLWLTLPGDVAFEPNRSALKPVATGLLDKVAAVLRSQPQLELRIVGHTDSKGSAAGNDALSLDRAASARDWLVARGLSPVSRSL
jgi:flagellar motor protein MotB